MKKMILLLTASALLIAATTVEFKKDHAQVNQVQGLYIFIYSEPLTQYTTLGNVTIYSNLGNRVEKITRKAKENYPDCEAIIFTDIDLKQGTCIKFQ